MPLLTKHHYQDALLVQSACNLSGVVISLSELMPFIRGECNSTTEVNEHPIVQMFVAQLLWLSYGQSTNQEKYDVAYEHCKQKVGV